MLIQHYVNEQEIYKDTQNYLEGFKLMNYKHIANGDIDFDGVINLEPHEQRKIL